MDWLLSWLLVNLSERQWRWLGVGLLFGSLVLSAGVFAFAGCIMFAYFFLVAAFVALFIGIWRERLLHSN